MSTRIVPRKTELLLDALGADSEFSHDVLGDLAEELAIRAEWEGLPAARRWYRREAIRVAPYLLGDWWRGLGRRNTANLVSAVARSWVITVVFESFVQRSAHRLGMLAWLWSFTRGLPAGQTLYLSVMLLWTLGDGTLCGYLAARIGRRAPLSSALIAAMFGGTLMLTLNILPVHPGRWVFRWYPVINSFMLAAGAIAGGMLRVCRRSAISRSVECELATRRDG